MSLLVVGDLHLRNDCDNHIKHEQSKMFMNWLSEQDFNNKNNKCLFLGDLIEYNISYETLFELKDWIDNLKFKEIIWLQGNHCSTSSDSVLNAFKNNPKIKLIIQPTVYFDEDLNKKYLLLPHYDYSIEDSKYIKMEERYSNLYKEEEFNGYFNYCFGHICDETQKFSDNDEICDLTKLDVDVYLHGHVHTPNFDKKGHYLGSVIKNSSTEGNDKKYIAEIKEDCFNFIEVPNFMNYYICEYGEFPIIDTPLAFIQVNNAPTKFDAEKLYKEHYKDIEIGFTKILTKRSSMITSDNKIDTVNDFELFDAFAKEKNLSNSVINICEKVL